MSKSLSLNLSVLITPEPMLPICPFALPARDAVLVAVSPYLMSQIINRAAFRSSLVPVVKRRVVKSCEEKACFLRQNWLLGKG